MTVTGWMAFSAGNLDTYNLKVADGDYSYVFNNTTGLSQLSEIPQAACIVFLGSTGCTNSGPFDSTLSYTYVVSTGVFSAFLDDAGEDFSASGTLTARGSTSLFEAASNVAAVPEPPTWAMMLLGFAGLGFAGYRRSRRIAGA
jgi:hypothetical protein